MYVIVSVWMAFPEPRLEVPPCDTYQFKVILLHHVLLSQFSLNYIIFVVIDPSSTSLSQNNKIWIFVLFNINYLVVKNPQTKSYNSEFRRLSHLEVHLFLQNKMFSYGNKTAWIVGP